MLNGSHKGWGKKTLSMIFIISTGVTEVVESIVAKIKSLPPLPQSIAQVQAICNDPEGSVKELIPIIETDPMFMADILKAANSPLYGFSRQITTIDQAVALFGMGTVQGFAISYAVRKTVAASLRPYNVSEKTLLNVAFMQSSLVFRWGKPQVSTYQNELQSISMLMELGKLVAARELAETGRAETFSDSLTQCQMLEEITRLELEYLKISSEWIGALMFKHWQFSEIMVALMRYAVDPAKAPESLRKHAQILHVAKEAFPLSRPGCESCLQQAFDLADNYNLNVEKLKSTVELVLG